MSLENFFLNNENSVDLPYKNIGDDPSAWQEKILASVYKIIDGADKMIRLEIKNKDEGTGYMLATAVITDKITKKTASIPVIVKDYMLAPLDVVIIDDKMIPLNNKNINSYFKNQQLFNRAVKPKPMFSGGEIMSAIGQHQSPQDGFYKISASREDIDKFKTNLDKKDFLKIASCPRGSKFLKNLEAHEDISMDKIASEHLMRDSNKTQMIEKIALDQYVITESPSDYFAPSIRKVAGSLMESGILPEISYHTSTADIKDGKTDAETKSEKYEEIGEATQFALYKARKKDGTEVRGVVFPAVIDFNQKPRDIKIFLSGVNSSIDTKINGMKLDEEGGAIPSGDVSPGKFGFFAYQSNGNSLATIPFTIASVTTGNQIVELTVSDFDGKKVILRVTPGIERIIPQPAFYSKIPVFSIPTSMKFVEIPGVVTLASKYELIKEAEAESYGLNKVDIISLNGNFAIRGLDKYAHELNKIGWNMDDLLEKQAKFILINLGCTPEASSALLEKSANNWAKVATIHP